MKALNRKNKHQLALFEDIVSEAIPSTRYQRSKAKLVDWIWECTKGLKFDSVLDILGGTGVVGYMYKRKGKAVCYNDYLKSNYLVGLSLVENNNTRLTNGDIQKLLEFDTSRNYRYFISGTFKDIYYTEKENQWLDIVVQNITQLENQYKKALPTMLYFKPVLSNVLSTFFIERIFTSG